MGRMKCHYEVLGVEQDIDGDGLKKAYRKLALKWHPDKNRDCIEEAEAMFKEIQAAYEVLSNPQERQWYDDHRESILRGEDGTEGESLVPNLYQWFRSSCYDGFADENPQNFYAVYGKVFQSVFEAENLGSKVSAPPSFGNSSSNHSDVEDFYRFWESFSSKLTFGWCDQYNPADGEGRYQRRQIEKINKKAREAGKKEYNEEVRNLVAFVKRRDIRMIEISKAKEQLRAEKEQQRLAALEEEQQRRKQAREAMAALYLEEQERQAREEADDTREPVFRLADEDDDNDEGITLHCCEVCNKTFKSAKQMRNHEDSKKHKQAVKELEREMREQDRILKQREQQEKRQAAAAKKQEIAASKSKEESDDAASTGSSSSNDSSSSSDDEGFGFGAFGRRHAAKKNDVSDEISEEEEIEKNVNESQGEEEDQVQVNEDVEEGGVESQDDDSNAPISENTTNKKTKKNKAKNNSELKGPVPSDQVTPHFCATCQSYFDSRNKLFTHLQKTNHAVAPGQVPTEKKSKKKKRR